jgi:hypothetical protein
MFIFFIAVYYSVLCGGASVMLLALPEGLQVVRLIPFDTTKLGKNPILIRE